MEGCALVRRGERPANLRRGGFGLVHRDRGAERADAEPAHQTADRELDPGGEGGDLDEDTDHENAALDGHGIATAEAVSYPEQGVSDVAFRRRGSQSTHGAPMRAPTRVPMLRSATISPSRTVEKLHVDALVLSAHVAKRRRKSSMRRMSEIWPVSYWLTNELLMQLRPGRRKEETHAENETSHRSQDGEHDGHPPYWEALAAETCAVSNQRSKAVCQDSLSRTRRTTPCL